MALTGGEIRLDHGHDGRVAYLTLDNGKFNTITWETRQVMADRFAEIDGDAKVQVVIIKAAGEHFSSGGDIPGFMEIDPVDFTDLGHNITAPSRSPKPVICAVDGYCFGVALELALSTDIRVCTSRSEFALPEMRLGMIPGSGGTQRLGMIPGSGGTQRLARLIGLSRAKYHIMTATRISGRQAGDWGLVAAVADDRAALETEVERIAGALLGFSPLALRTAKEVLDKGADAPLYSGIELERKAYAMLRSSKDFAEGVSAFSEKRPPHFQGR